MINIYQLQIIQYIGHGVYIYRYIDDISIYQYIIYIYIGLFIDHAEFHAWVPARPRWSFALPTSDAWRNSRPWPCCQGWESVQRRGWWWWWWWWWWRELHNTWYMIHWYTTLAPFGVRNRGVITYYICIYIYILAIYYLVYIYMYKYILYTYLYS